jgi:hypothetical protein
LNIVLFLFSSFDLIERDINLVLPCERNAARILDDLRSELSCAFRMREELINMKKVAYHVHHSGSLIERSLAQLATYFRTDHADCDSINTAQAIEAHEETTSSSAYFVHSDRFTTIVDARMRCKGACHAAADARAMAKQICCLPRHPLKKRPTIMANLPRTLETAGLVRNALQTLNSDDSFSDLVSLDMCSSGDDMNCKTWQLKVERKLMDLTDADSNPFPIDVVEFARLIVICRGADKAVRMVDEVYSAIAAVRYVCAQIDALLPLLSYREDMLSSNVEKLRLELSNVSSDEQSGKCSQLSESISTMIRKRIHYHRHLNLLSGALPHLIELVAWLKKISSIADTGHDEVMFLGSDSTADRHTLPAALQVPKVEVDTMALFKTYREVESRYRPQMFNAIRTRGWPPSLQHALATSNEKEAKVADNKHCHVCERTYSCLWVHRGVCCECEDRIRHVENRCPFRSVCKSDWFCAHSRRCLICDAHSCSDCRLVRGDASTVAAVAGDIKPRRIAFDFDRTIASTKSGAAPIVGKHAADVDLISLMWKYSCVVVTRNQNKEAIRLFLEDQGAPPGTEICIVGKKESKAAHILGFRQTGEGDTNLKNLTPVEDTRPILFVDDSVQELADPLVAQESSIYRVLFVRSLA